MKRIVLILILTGCCFSLHCQNEEMWKRVMQRYDACDYEGMKSILDTATIEKIDSALYYQWIGQYYYWMSYEDRAMGSVSEKYFYDAIRLFEKEHFSDNRPGFCYLHLAELQYLYGKYDEAIKHLEKALTVSPYKARKRDLENPTPVYKGLGMCYAMKKDYERALQYLDRCDTAIDDAYSAMRMKGKVYAMKGDTASSIRCYNEFISQMRKIVSGRFQRYDDRDKESWWMSVRPFITDSWRLGNAAPGMLYDVALLTKGILLQKDSSSLEITHSDIRKVLAKGNVAIEWMTYENGGERLLGAVVMRSDGKMSFVRTGVAADFNRWSLEMDEIYENDSCIAALWSPEMMQAIGNASKIYFAPDGILNQVGIEYMFPDTSVQLYRLTSTRELLNKRKHDYSSAAIFGDVDYDQAKADTVETQIANDEEAYTFIKNRRLFARRLRYSAPECDTILAIRNSDGDTIILDQYANEGNFRSVAERYKLLFVSTHGYCRTTTRFEDTDFPRRDKVDHSLSESGLLFTGFNAEQKKRTASTDGIVSARELCRMDLHNVELCIVSACEGALGRASADGTYGIQRGFKSAGVGSMILSLWEVDDEATSLFMTYLFTAMAEGKDVHDAFVEARRNLRNYTYTVSVFDSETFCSNPVVIRRFNSPRYYNSFILIDEI